MGTNLPVDELDGLEEPEDEDGVGDGLAAEAVRVVAAYRTAPPTPPTSIDPAMAAAMAVLRIPFTVLPPFRVIAT